MSKASLLANELDIPSEGGILLVNVARHVSRALSDEGRGSVPEIMNSILNTFENELASPTDLGNTQKVHQN